jgi:chemotaxis protein methyltransferase CheR
MLSDIQFDRTRRLALSLAGIELAERHRELLARRGRRPGAIGPAGLDSLLDAVEKNEPAATRRLLCLLTTKFTGFLRHPRHFEIAATRALQAIRRRGQARLWSAATATGEEAYSLAMVLIEASAGERPAATILATDLDVEALTAARRGEYAEATVRSLSPERRLRFFSRAASGDPWRIAAAVRQLVEFQELNLIRAPWPIRPGFDVIFCRNVLMYLEARHRRAVLERMASLLVPDGLLLLDPTEHLGAASPLFTSGVEGVYALRPGAGPRT